MAFQATISLNKQKRVPLTHTGFKGRVLQKGMSFTTTNPEEAAYYEAQPGFSVVVKKGKLRAAPKPEPEELSADHDDESGDDEGDEEEEREPEVKGGYERADLKKMSKADLLDLIKNDKQLPLKKRDVPKDAGKKEIIDMILDAQSGSDE